MYLNVNECLLLWFFVWMVMLFWLVGCVEGYDYFYCVMCKRCNGEFIKCIWYLKEMLINKIIWVESLCFLF